MSHNNGYIYDPEYDEHYVPDKLQCEDCSNEAVINGLCEDCDGTERMLNDEAAEELDEHN